MASRATVAIDIEFIKCRGLHYARSVAFVPFASSPSPDKRSCRTIYPQPPMVIAMKSPMVMCTSDLLPCGHILQPFITEHMVQGDALDALKASFRVTAQRAFDTYRDRRRAVREERQNLRKQDSQRKVPPGEPLDEPSSSPPVITKGLSAAEQAERRTLQIRLALTEHFDILDPYGIPNVRTADKQALYDLFAKPIDSEAFRWAVQAINPLRAYGRGRGRLKPLALLARYYPELLQAVLHASFSSPQSWCEFLESCAAAVEKDLQEVETHHANVLDPGNFIESNSLELFSEELNKGWVHWQESMKTNKFFVYGNADARVLHNTLHLSCHHLRNNSFSDRALKAGWTNRINTSPSDSKTEKSNTVITPVQRGPPSGVLLSPYQARVHDITAHPLFATSGLMRSNRGVPSLSEALQKIIAADKTAAGVWAEQRAHDPLWDAQALACICVASGVPRT